MKFNTTFLPYQAIPPPLVQTRQPYAFLGWEWH